MIRSKFFQPNILVCIFFVANKNILYFYSERVEAQIRAYELIEGNLKR